MSQTFIIYLLVVNIYLILFVQLLEKDVNYQKALIKKFGHSIVNDQGKIDKSKLGDLIFSNPE